MADAIGQNKRPSHSQSMAIPRETQWGQRGELSARCFKQIWKVGKVGKVGSEGSIMPTWNQL